MKSFIEHTNEIDEEVLDNKPKEAVDEAAGMGDLLIGLGAAGGLLALKKGWDAFGKGSKLARGLAFTQKQKAKVAKDAEEKRKGKVDDASAILNDPKAKQKDKDKAQKTLDKHQTSAEKDKAIVDKDKEAKDKKDTATAAKEIGTKAAQDKFDQSRKKYGADAQPPKGFSLDPEDKSGKTVIPTADAKRIKLKGKDLDRKITAKGPKPKKNPNQEKPKHGGKKGGFRHGQAGTSKKSQKKAARKAMIKKATGSESFIPYCMSVLSDLTEDFTKEDRTQLLEELVLEETMTLQESEELQAIMALDDAKIKADINKKGQVVVKKKDLKKAEKILKKEFGGKFKTLMPKLVGEEVLEDGTDAIINQYKKDTPGQVDEAAAFHLYPKRNKVGDEIEKLASKGGAEADKLFVIATALQKGRIPNKFIRELSPKRKKEVHAIMKDFKWKDLPEEVIRPRTAWDLVSKARAKVSEAVDAEAARELYLFIQNERDLMRQKSSIIKNIARKMKSGKYDHKQAPKLWMYWVESGAKLYDKLYGSPGVKTFDKDTKMSVAIQLGDEYKAEIELGNYS